MPQHPWLTTFVINESVRHADKLCNYDRPLSAVHLTLPYILFPPSPHNPRPLFASHCPRPHLPISPLNLPASSSVCWQVHVTVVLTYGLWGFCPVKNWLSLFSEYKCKHTHVNSASGARLHALPFIPVRVLHTSYSQTFNTHYVHVSLILSSKRKALKITVIRKRN